MSRYRMPHTATRKGKRVIVRMRDGEVFIDRFKDRTDKYVELYERGRVLRSAIKAFGIYKEGRGTYPHPSPMANM